MKINYIILAITLTLIFGPIKNIMSQQNLPDINYYYLKVETNDAVSLINLNGAPVVKSEDTDALITTEPVNLWLKENNNILSFEILEPDDKTENLNPEIKVTLFLHDKSSETPAPKSIIASLELDTSKEPEYPIKKSVTFNFKDKVLTNVWEDADKIDSITNTDKNEILQLATSFLSSILDKKYDIAINIQGYKIKEEALAEGKSNSHLIDITKETYDWLGTQGPLTSQPIEPGELKFTICGDSKLIYLSKKNNEEAIIIESEDLYLDIATYYAKINGKWTIAR